MLKCLAAVLLAFALVSLQADAAFAQAEVPSEQRGEEIKGDIAGTVGLGILGAELGLLLTPTFNLQDHWWAWALFPTIGAAGGVVAGIFAFEPRDPSPEITISILGASMLLAVPAIVGAASIAARRRGRDFDRAQEGGLLRFSKRGANVGVPSVSRAPVFSAAEQARFGLPQQSSTRVSLVSGRF